IKKLSAIEEVLVPSEGDFRIKTMQVPPKLLAEYRFLYEFVASSDGKPTAGATERLRDLAPKLDEQLSTLRRVLDADLRAFNGMLRDKGVPTVVVPGSASRPPAT